MKYQKTKSVIEAIQATGEWYGKLKAMIGYDFEVCEWNPLGGKMYYEINIPALNAELTVPDGYYIAMDKHGSMFIFDKVSFEFSYAPVSEDLADTDKKAPQDEINKLKADYVELEREYESLGESLEKSTEMVRRKREEIDQLKAELTSLRDENLALAYENATLKSDEYAPRLRMQIVSTLNEHELNETLEWLRCFLELKNLYIANQGDGWYTIISTGKECEGREEEILEGVNDAVRTKEATKSGGTKKEKLESERNKAFIKACESIAEEKAHKCGGSCKCADKDAEIAKLKDKNTELMGMLDATYRGLKCVQKIQAGTADMSDLASGLDATLSMLKIAQAVDGKENK